MERRASSPGPWLAPRQKIAPVPPPEAAAGENSGFDFVLKGRGFSRRGAAGLARRLLLQPVNPPELVSGRGSECRLAISQLGTANTFGLQDVAFPS
jgi:hypothetical protein